MDCTRVTVSVSDFSPLSMLEHGGNWRFVSGDGKSLWNVLSRYTHHYVNMVPNVEFFSITMNEHELNDFHTMTVPHFLKFLSLVMVLFYVQNCYGVALPGLKMLVLSYFSDSNLDEFLYERLYRTWFAVFRFTFVYRVWSANLVPPASFRPFRLQQQYYTKHKLFGSDLTTSCRISYACNQLFSIVPTSLKRDRFFLVKLRLAKL